VPDTQAEPPAHVPAAVRRGLAPRTVVVTAGRPPAQPDAPLNVPVVLASTFRAGGRIEYAREGSPTGEALEEAVAALEGGTAVAFGSGMAAVNAVLDLVPAGGVIVAPTHAYTGVAVRLTELAAADRLDVRRVDVTDTAAIEAACQGAALLWLESPTNPMLEVADIRAGAQAAHEAGAITLCDNTFATPLLQQPLSLGCDIVLHSATKFLGGHSDLLLGVCCAADPDLADRLRTRRVLLGAAPGALECYLALRGIRTLALRVDAAQRSARTLAERLVEHPAVARVRYPGLPGDPGHGRAAAQMAGPGAIIAFEPVGGAAAADRLCAATRLWVHATSLGGVESLLERRRRWPAEAADVPRSLIRLSVGIEDVEDLWADLAAALDAAAAGAATSR
jgi:cystathionine gamma-synthase